ncbi:hypothetical protein [Dolichospermum phage Dfl-JY45]
MPAYLIAVTLATLLAPPVDAYGRPLTPGEHFHPVPDIHEVAPSSHAPAGWHFAPPVVMPDLQSGWSVALADLTGDGRQDLLASHIVRTPTTSLMQLRLYTHDEHGALSLSWKETLPTYPHVTLVPTWFGRGRAPAVAVITREGISMLMHWSAHGPAHMEVGPPSTPARADWIPSPRGDAGALITGGNDTLQLHHTSTGELTSAPFPQLFGGHSQGAVADIDGDGDYDFAFTAWNNAGAFTGHVLRNVGTSNQWQFKALPQLHLDCDGASSSFVRGLAIGDFNSDGHDDIALAQDRNAPRSCIGIAYGDGSGTYSAPVIHPSMDLPNVLRAADIDGDGRTDLLSFHGGHSRVGVHLQRPDGTLADPLYVTVPYASHYYPQGVAIGDFMGDGCLDVAIANAHASLVLLEGRDCAVTYTK